jgi:hypothetical protein
MPLDFHEPTGDRRHFWMPAGDGQLSQCPRRTTEGSQRSTTPTTRGEQLFFKGRCIVYDLAKLNDDEIALLEQLLKIAAGEIEGDVVEPSFRIERVFVDTAEPTDDANRC